MLYQRGTLVSHDALREWCINFGPLFTHELRHREPRPCSRWHLIDVCTSVNGVRHGVWRAVDEYGFVQGGLFHQHRNTEAAKTFLTRLLGEYDGPEVIHTDGLRSSGAAIREISSLAEVDYHQVISKTHGNNLIEQEHRSTRRQERSQQGFRRPKRAQEFLNLHARITHLHHHSRTSVCAAVRRRNQKRTFQKPLGQGWSEVQVPPALRLL